MYGYKSVKWVTRIELDAKPREGFWEQHGYDSDAWLDDAKKS
jgi:methionine sulfoxide reductase catalytic subunit